MVFEGTAKCTNHQVLVQANDKKVTQSDPGRESLIVLYLENVYIVSCWYRDLTTISHEKLRIENPSRIHMAQPLGSEHLQAMFP